MLILNPEWERKQVPSALAQLSKDLTVSVTHDCHTTLLTSLQELAAESGEKQESPEKYASLDERKLDCVRFAPGVEPRTPTTVSLCAMFVFLAAFLSALADYQVYISLSSPEQSA